MTGFTLDSASPALRHLAAEYPNAISWTPFVQGGARLHDAADELVAEFSSRDLYDAALAISDWLGHAEQEGTR